MPGTREGWRLILWLGASVAVLTIVLSIIITAPRPLFDGSYFGATPSVIVSIVFLVMPVAPAYLGWHYPAWRLSMWKLGSAIAGAAITGWVAEAFHATGQPCYGVLGVPRGSVVAVCIHPRGFWFGDYAVLAYVTLLTILLLWMLSEVIDVLRQRISENQRPGKEAFRRTGRKGGWIVSVAGTATLAGVTSSALVYLALGQSWVTRAPFVVYQLQLPLILPLTPALLAFSLLMIQRSALRIRLYPGFTAFGTYVAGLLGILAWGPLFRQTVESWFLAGPIVFSGTLVAAAMANQLMGEGRRLAKWAGNL